MKVVVDLRSLSGSPWSGVPIYTREIVSALTTLKSEHEWTGYTSGRSAGSISVGSIGQYWHGPFSNTVSTLLWNLPGSHFRSPPPSNVLFLPNWNILPSRLPCPLVATLHDCSAQRLPSDGGIKRRLWHKAIRIPRLLRQAHSLICVSESTAQEVRTFFPSEQKKIHVIPLATPSRHAHECGSICAKWSQEKKPIVVVLSDGHRRKNIDSALTALSRVHAPHRTIVIGIQTIHEPRGTLLFGLRLPAMLRNALQAGNSLTLRQSSAQKPVFPAFRESTSTIDWIGSLEPVRFDALLSHAALLVYPSLYEGYGFPPQEAIARNIPVIAGSSPAVAQVSGEQCLLVNPLDIAQMQRAIEEVLRGSIQIKHSQTHPRTWKQVAQETFAVLEKAAEHSGRV